jgi:membrane protein required for colicin V production
MTWLDWTILLVVGLSTVISLRRGFVKEALSLLAWVVAFLVSTAFSERLAALFVEYIANDTLRKVSAYVILFAATLMLGSLVNSLMAQVVRATGLTGADRVLGTVFGFARGLVVILVAIFLMEAVLEPEELEFMRESRLMPHLAMVEQWARETFGNVRADGQLPWLESS